MKRWEESEDEEVNSKHDEKGRSKPK